MAGNGQDRRASDGSCICHLHLASNLYNHTAYNVGYSDSANPCSYCRQLKSSWGPLMIPRVSYTRSDLTTLMDIHVKPSLFVNKPCISPIAHMSTPQYGNAGASNLVQTRILYCQSYTVITYSDIFMCQRVPTSTI